MVKVYTSTYAYDHAFPLVSLAYFLRYPNPYSTHVQSTDVISRQFDPQTRQLTTTRLHLKRSKLPSAVLRLIPRSLLGATAAGDSQSYILETSVVDVNAGWMKTESRNLEWTGVLSVVERQDYYRQGELRPASPASSTSFAQTSSDLLPSALLQGKTDVVASVTLRSPFGENVKKRRAAAAAAKAAGDQTESEPKVGFFRSWSQGSIQRSIELIGLNKARKSQPNAKEGMKVVLERLREGGIVGVLEGMRRDRETAFATGLHVPGNHGHDDDDG
ncbi:MSF1-domain-containing protein [Eremomyces bilateralis CBS 781.70]|uniref:MSF1-domain-containing protein n=1 Tax=Eremomyces bilateralis CBS 781.70 TaxID=1392243 RepID=A0A6G1FUD1_9PEZI|nr:MSF1-domain-containing protein [Eremomyces bilateralis CBS 781.70]KAF1809261.1 MSF1-domain-containing protein [Eremomyces bilateralis CBS 781.70]